MHTLNRTCSMDSVSLLECSALENQISGGSQCATSAGPVLVPLLRAPQLSKFLNVARRTVPFTVCSQLALMPLLENEKAESDLLNSTSKAWEVLGA
jgi:hypothetical protein